MADMNIQLSAFFANTSVKGNFIHAVLYIDGKDIAFIDDVNGNKKSGFLILSPLRWTIKIKLLMIPTILVPFIFQVIKPRKSNETV